MANIGGTIPIGGGTTREFLALSYSLDYPLFLGEGIGEQKSCDPFQTMVINRPYIKRGVVYTQIHTGK